MEGSRPDELTKSLASTFWNRTSRLHSNASAASRYPGVAGVSSSCSRDRQKSVSFPFAKRTTRKAFPPCMRIGSARLRTTVCSMILRRMSRPRFDSGKSCIEEPYPAQLWPPFEAANWESRAKPHRTLRLRHVCSVGMPRLTLRGCFQHRLESPKYLATERHPSRRPAARSWSESDGSKDTNTERQGVP